MTAESGLGAFASGTAGVLAASVSGSVAGTDAPSEGGLADWACSAGSGILLGSAGCAGNGAALVGFDASETALADSVGGFVG